MWDLEPIEINLKGLSSPVSAMIARRKKKEAPAPVPSSDAITSADVTGKRPSPPASPQKAATAVVLGAGGSLDEIMEKADMVTSEAHKHGPTCAVVCAALRKTADLIAAIGRGESTPIRHEALNWEAMDQLGSKETSLSLARKRPGWKNVVQLSHQLVETISKSELLVL